MTNDKKCTCITSQLVNARARNQGGWWDSSHSEQNSRVNDGRWWWWWWKRTNFKSTLTRQYITTHDVGVTSLCANAEWRCSTHSKRWNDNVTYYDWCYMIKKNGGQHNVNTFFQPGMKANSQQMPTYRSYSNYWWSVSRWKQSPISQYLQERWYTFCEPQDKTRKTREPR